MARLLVWMLLTAAAASTTAEDWCPGVGKFSQADREALLNAHNALRSRIALGTMTANGKEVTQAANMEKMTWDCDLERDSQKYSESTDCVMEHSKQSTRPGIGENLARPFHVMDPHFYNTSAAAEYSTSNWAGEYEACEFTSNIYPSPTTCMIGHATAMAWASSNRLGCGVQTGVECGRKNDDWTPEGSEGYYPTFVVCRYAPRGNIGGKAIYKEGKACTQCPAGTTCESETGLCKK